jgi:hypothetical protein
VLKQEAGCFEAGFPVGIDDDDEIRIVINKEKYTRINNVVRDNCQADFV